jgi:inorganic triphosphatase YgiF
MDETLERELKLVPASERLLDTLAGVDHLDRFEVVGRRRELQHNAFFDSKSQSLREARVGFRRRSVEGRSLATWTIKGDAQHVGGVSTRSEIELLLDADMAPALVLGALRDAARTRGAGALAEAVEDALRSGGLPLARPFLETDTDRTILDLREGEQGWEVELALDRMRIVGHDYAEVEIEAELKRGAVEALDGIRAAIAAIGLVRESEGSKLSRAAAHVADCDCPLSRSAPR